MTRPRMNPDRQLFGILGVIDDVSSVLQWWNERFQAAGIDAFMDRYHCTALQLPERLSEMYHFDRRGYIVGSSLQEAIIPLLDQLDQSVVEEGRVDTVVNQGGVLHGVFCADDHERRWQLWLKN